MTAVRWKPGLALAALLAAATAAASVIIAADVVIDCREVEPAGSDSVSLTLPGLEQRTLSTSSIYEASLAESSRVAGLSARLPQLRVVLDTGQPAKPPAGHARWEMEPVVDGISWAGATDLPLHADILDTLCLPTTPEKMIAACGEMDSLLRDYERNDTAVASLLRVVRNEQTALRGIWPGGRTRLLSGAGGILGMAAGTWLGWIKGPPRCAPPLMYFNPFIEPGCVPTPGTCVIGTAPLGCAVGGVVGYVLGAGVGALLREDALKEHGNRVNELVRRVNRAVASAR
ncbi:hypothetical protein JXD38_04300 [candidate division WOR-3 bacterium]|nr:hypothetical protein [candidate division WOR-3 bacterium]